MSGEARTIAASLTDAQRRAILDAEDARDGFETFYYRRYRDRGRLVQSLHDAGLGFITTRGVMLNAKAMAVRSILTNPETDR